MKNPLKKIFIIIVLILVLPITAFFIYQFANLNESEGEINEIYLQQLESILYSVNQYSEDIVSSWANDFIINTQSEKVEDEERLKLFLRDNNSIKYLFHLNLKNEEAAIQFFTETNPPKSIEDSLKQILAENKGKLEKLKSFLDVGYRKIEAIGKFPNSNLYLCLFPSINKNEKQIGGLLFDPSEFINLNLAAKISQACGDEFVLAVVDKQKNIIHSCDKISPDEILVSKELWLLPGLSLGIKMKNGSIEDFVNQRFFTNFIILLSLLIILLLGLVLIYYNIRKELRLTQIKADFISNVSHELRTPLSLISMYSETLVLDRIKDEEKKKEYYSVIHNETNRLSKIVNSILNFSKMEAGTRKYNFEPIRLQEINNEILNTYDYHIKAKGFSYQTKSETDLEEIWIDKDAISESIINLIENAIKYSAERKRLDINIGINDNGAYWEIKDYGIGISNEDQNKIFDKFFRVSTGLVHNTKGTGLGLSLVKQIMEAHKGMVLVKSKINIGSTFRLQFNKNFKGN